MLIFASQFDQLKGGNASGDRAARRVLELTREHFAGDTRLDTDYTILCYSFWCVHALLTIASVERCDTDSPRCEPNSNVWGLKNYLFENNLINVHEDFEEFRQGFNSVSASDALFNILDSGGVKQSADWLLARESCESLVRSPKADQLISNRASRLLGFQPDLRSHSPRRNARQGLRLAASQAFERGAVEDQYPQHEKPLSSSLRRRVSFSQDHQRLGRRLSERSALHWKERDQSKSSAFQS